MPKNPYNFTPATLKGRLPAVVGDVIFVDSVNGVANADGTSLRPFNKIENALNKSGLSSGDVIVVMPGHTETVSSATALNFDVAGVTIIGMGNGLVRPTITLDTATTATIPVTAANMTLDNVIISANFADIVAVFTLGAAKDFVVKNCDIKATATDMNFKYVFDTNTTDNSADGLTFVNCSWIEPDAATISLCKVDATQARWKFNDNYISAVSQATGGGMFVIATGKILTNLQCYNNKARLIGGDLSGAGVVFTTDQSTNTGVFANNYIQHTDTASEIFGTASSGFSVFENRMSGVAGATGYVLPAVDS